MTLDTWYWLFMAIWLLFGLWGARGHTVDFYPYVGSHLLIFVLFVLIGLKSFGSPVK